jgi:hypothetical protein
VRQYSPALAEDGAIAPNVSANNAAAGAVLIFKSGFIFFSLLASAPAADMGCRLCPRHQHRKKAKEFSL